MLQQERASGLARLSLVWDELATLARTALPDAESLIQANSLYLTADESRLHLTYVDPDDTDPPLLVAELVVRHLDVPTPLYAANAICSQRNGRPDWPIATFSPNALRSDAPRLPRGLGGRGAGLPVADAMRLLKIAKKPASGPHIPPVTMQSEQLTEVSDFLTGKLVNDTPEEYVRQNIEKALVRQYKYAPADCSPEFPIKVGSSRKRVDIMVFAKGVDHTQANTYILIETKKG